MKDTSILTGSVLCLLLVCGGSLSTLVAGEINAAQAPHTIQINVPVKLETAMVVFNMSQVAFNGDMPIGLRGMRIFANRFAEQNVKGQIIGVFQGDAGYLTLNDSTYNAYRSVSTGNPYKALLAELLKQGVQLEECAVTMKARNWGNEDLLPGIKVNTGGVLRLIQLNQTGYVQIQP